MAFVAMLLIRLYQRWLRRFLPPGVCNMNPSCSEYSLLVFKRHGFVTGLRLTRARLKRCGGDLERPLYVRMSGGAKLALQIICGRHLTAPPEPKKTLRQDSVL